MINRIEPITNNIAPQKEDIEEYENYLNKSIKEFIANRKEPIKNK